MSAVVSKLSQWSGALAPLLLFTSAWADQPVEIAFAGAFGDRHFTCGQQVESVGVTASTITPVDFRLYIHDVALINTQGVAVPVTLNQDGIWQYQNVVLLDFENGSGPCLNGNEPVNHHVRGTVPEGEYTGLSFIMGLPYELNHDDVTLSPSPLNLSAMFWNWRGGHRFLKVDMSTSGRPIPSPGAASNRMSGGMSMDEEAPGFPLHIGSTGCVSSSRTTAPDEPCANLNVVPVHIGQFDSSSDVVLADILPLLRNTNVDVNTTDTAPGCMSGADDPECIGIFSALGLGSRATDQQMFRVE